jgi:nicotinamidase-related amidase
MDYQSQFSLTINSTKGDALVKNAIDLAKIAKTFNIPTVLTTIGQTSFGGPLFSKIQEIFPDQESIDRSTLSLFEDTRIFVTIEKMGRKKLVIAGLWTDFGVAASIRQARDLGYEVFMIVDACGDVTLRAHQMAVQRILREGVILMTWLQMFLALHQDYAPPEVYAVLLNIVKDHASAYGLEIQYSQVDLDEGQPKWLDGKSKERWWRKCSMVPVRTSRRHQKKT